MKGFVVLHALIMLACIGRAHGSILVNGSFEDGPETIDGWYIVYDGDSTTIPGWTVKTPLPGRDIDIVSTYWRSADGDRSIDLSGLYGPGGIAQTFATTPGNRYDVFFMLAGNTGTREPRQSHLIFDMGVTAAGQTQIFSFDVFGHSYLDMGWELRTWSFVADSTSSELWFYQIGDPYPTGGPALDNVQVFDRGAAIPEPASAAVWSLLAVVGAGLLVRRIPHSEVYRRS